jgi:hypothetical protein
MSAGDQGAVPPQRVLLKADGMYQWRGRKMGKTIFNVRRGNLTLTENCLAFVAKGGTDVWWQIALESTGFVPGAAGNVKLFHDAGKAVYWAGDALREWLAGAGAPAEEFFTPPRTDVLKDGSFIVAPEAIDAFGVVAYRQFGFPGDYLWVSFQDQSGAVQDFTFADKHRIPGGKLWEEAIQRLKGG